MSSIFACDLGLNRKTLSRNFFCCFVFCFREIFFNQHWRQNARFADSVVWKNKSFLWKGHRQEKTAFLHTLFVENERETSKLKWGAMFFSKVEGHMPKLSSFGRGKKFRPKKSLTSLLHAALQEYNSTGNELSCKSYCDVYKIRFGAKQIQCERVVDCGGSLPEALVSLTFFSAAW